VVVLTPEIGNGKCVDEEFGDNDITANEGQIQYLTLYACG
jgi:hypothetical protein